LKKHLYFQLMQRRKEAGRPEKAMGNISVPAEGEVMGGGELFGEAGEKEQHLKWGKNGIGWGEGIMDQKGDCEKKSH